MYDLYIYIYIVGKSRGVFLMPSNGKNATHFFPYLIYIYIYSVYFLSFF